MGGVFSQNEGFTALRELWGAIIFHTVTLALGVWCFGRGIELRETT